MRSSIVAGILWIFATFERIWRFCRKWMIHAFIGWPLLSAYVWSAGATSQYADIYDVAIKAPSFWREGTITRPDLRGRRLQLTEPDGTAHEIRCYMGPTAGSSCLFGRQFPIKASVEMFNYRNSWIIFTIIDKKSGKILFDKETRLENLKMDAEFLATRTPEINFHEGIVFGIITIPLIIIFELLTRWKERVLARRRMNSAQ